MSELNSAHVKYERIFGEASPLAAALPQFLAGQRWFAGKTQSVSQTTISDAVLLEAGPGKEFWLMMVDVLFENATRQRYAMPVSLQTDSGEAVDSKIVDAESTGHRAVHDASAQPEFWAALVRTSLRTGNSDTERTSHLQFVGTDCETGWSSSSRIPVEVPDTEQSNSSAVLDDRCFLKLFRRPSDGVNPDVEVARFLSLNTGFSSTPKVLGHIELRRAGEPSECLALLTSLVAADGDAWTFTLAQIDAFWQRLFLSQKLLEVMPPEVDWSIASAGQPLPGDAELAGDFLKDARLLGQRTAQMHIALSSNLNVPEFRPEPVPSFQKLLDTIRSEIDATKSMLESADLADPVAPDLPAQIRETALRRLAEFENSAAGLDCRQIRVHGDYHLGQILRTDDDFLIIDFEGEPDRPVAERREKRSAMKDVAGMIRSLHYAASAGAAALVPALEDRRIPDNVAAWQRFWFGCTARSFLTGYLEAAAGQVFLPETNEQTQQLLDLFLLEKVLYELRYELNNRPDWVAIPLAGLKDVLGL